MVDQPNQQFSQSARLAMETSLMQFTLRSAASYFNVSCDYDGGDSSIPRKSPTSMMDLNADSWSRTASEHNKEQGLTGKIISATAHIPWVVGVTDDGKFELTSRQEESAIHDCLSYLSSSSTWKHTVVGWTGEILPASSAEFVDRRQRKESTASATSSHKQGHVGDVFVHGVDDSGLNRAFMQRFKDKEKKDQSHIVTKANRKELEALLQHVFKDTIVPVWLGDWSTSQEDTLIIEDQSRWSTYSDKLYKVLGSDWDQPQDDGQAFQHYKRRNEAMADAILKVYQPGDIVWVHDYQLMLLPEILQRKLPSAQIVYFHHTSWCPKEILINLPEHRTLMEGLLGAAAIGVSCGSSRNYIADYYHQQMQLYGAEGNLVHFHGRHTSIENVPDISNNTQVQAAAFGNDKVETAISFIRQTYSSKKIMVARARLDAPVSTTFLLNGYAHYLDRYTDRAAVLFLITASGLKSSAMEQSVANNLNEDIASQVMGINSKFGSPTYQPIIYLGPGLPDPDYYALLRLADVGFVTTDHEELNAMSVEFLVCQQELQSPLLIVDRSVAVADHENATLTESSHPSGSAATAAKVHEALSMSDDEKRRVHKYMYDYFSKHNVASFVDEFVRKAISSFNERAPTLAASLLDVEQLSKAYRAAPKRLFMFDYDGTLTPIVNDPDAAVPTEQLLTSLSKVATDTTKDHVWLISGRSRKFLEKHFGHITGIGLSAEHGCFVRRPLGTEWENLAAIMDMGWKTEVDKVFRGLEQAIAGSWIERKEVAVVWHYRNAVDHEVCLTKAIETKALLEVETLKPWDVEIMLGKANMEVRPRFLNKGVMAANLVQEVFGNEGEGFVLCAGDDTTDEDMFRALLASKLKREGIFSCLVAKEAKPSLAYYRIGEPEELVDAVSTLSTA